MREYEKYLATKEIEKQFPDHDKLTIGSKDVELITSKQIDEEKLKKLSFFSLYNIQNGYSIKTGITNQVIVENYLNNLPSLFQDIEIKKTRNIRYLTHSFHEYKGRFYPQLAKSFMNYAGIKKGDTVLDPFCGSGTTLVECALNGVDAIGVDINPIAILLAKAKVRSLLLSSKDLTFICKAFTNLSEKTTGWDEISLINYKKTLDIEYLQRWFPLENLQKIISIQNIINSFENEDYQLFSKVILSNLLREYSYQDPTQLRIRVRKDNPPNNIIATFERKVLEHIADLEKFQSINKFDFSSNIQPYLGDVRSLMKSANLSPSSIDVVITSPPYATALPYIDTDRLSLFAFGFTDKSNFRKLEESLIGNREITKSKRESIDKELEINFELSILPNEIVQLLKKIYLLNKNSDVGFRRKNTAALLYKYFLDMNLGLNQVSQVLKKNHYAFFVVGNNRTMASNENISIPTDDFIGLIGENNNLGLVEKINMSVQKSYSIHSKNSISSESILVFQRK